jgi:hypothetical protein
MKPVPHHGEDTYKGSDRLTDKKAIIAIADEQGGKVAAVIDAKR